MNKINAYTIQKQLRETAFVSVPRIQQTYGLNYRQAKRFLQNLLDRGWIAEKPMGIRYRVRKDMLKLRDIRKEETTDLLNAITCDATAALLCVIKKSGAGFTELEEVVRGREDTLEAIAVLLKMDLIYCWNDRFYPCVSGKVARVLDKVASEKARIESRSRILKKEEDYNKLLVLFQVLFEDA